MNNHCNQLLSRQQSYHPMLQFLSHFLRRYELQTSLQKYLIRMQMLIWVKEFYKPKLKVPQLLLFLHHFRLRFLITLFHKRPKLFLIPFKTFRFLILLLLTMFSINQLLLYFLHNPLKNLKLAMTMIWVMMVLLDHFPNYNSNLRKKTFLVICSCQEM